MIIKVLDLMTSLSAHFHKKDLGLLRDFIGAEVARSQKTLVSVEISYRSSSGDEHVGKEGH